jgi:hypothetical protein
MTGHRYPSYGKLRGEPGIVLAFVAKDWDIGRYFTFDRYLRSRLIIPNPSLRVKKALRKGD